MTALVENVCQICLYSMTPNLGMTIDFFDVIHGLQTAIISDHSSLFMASIDLECMDAF